MCCKEKNNKKECCEKKQSCGCTIELATECIRWTTKKTDFAKENENLENILKNIYNAILTEDYINRIIENEKFQEYLEANYYKK